MELLHSRPLLCSSIPAQIPDNQRQPQPQSPLRLLQLANCQPAHPDSTIPSHGNHKEGPSLRFSPIPSASWSSPVLPHLVLHGVACPFLCNKLSFQWLSSLDLLASSPLNNNKMYILKYVPQTLCFHSLLRSPRCKPSGLPGVCVSENGWILEPGWPLTSCSTVSPLLHSPPWPLLPHAQKWGSQHRPHRDGWGVNEIVQVICLPSTEPILVAAWHPLVPASFQEVENLFCRLLSACQFYCSVNQESWRKSLDDLL